MNKNIKKNYLENPNAHIDYSLWNKKTNYDSTWSIDRNPIFICIVEENNSLSSNILFNYLRYVKKSANIFSKNLVKASSGLYTNDYVKSDIYNLDALATFLWLCTKDKPEYIIIAGDKDMLNADKLLDKFQFDYKIITSIKDLDEEILDSFLSNLPCPTLLCADNVNEDIVNKEYVDLYLKGPKIVYSDRAEEYLKEIETKLNKNIRLYPYIKFGQLDKSFIYYCVEGVYYKLESTLPFYIGANLCIDLLTIISLINIFDHFNIKNFLLTGIKNIVITYEDTLIKDIYKYFNSKEYSKILKQIKKDFPNTVFNNVKKDDLDVFFNNTKGIDNNE